MISAIIAFSVRNRLIVLLGTAALAVWGVVCLYRTPIDAIPDLSENQVIVWADWMGRSPKEIEDQVTYPLSVNLQGLAGVKSIRATSEFGFSMINIIFEETVEFYFARQRVLERLSIAGNFLPPGVVPYLAPDATALGQIFWYTVEGDGVGLDELRSVQDWYVRYQLNAVPGVAQVAGVGGFVREYQIDIAPEKMRAWDISLGQIFQAVMASNSSVGGKVIHKGGAEYLVRGYGWIRSLEDLGNVVVVERDGVPITVKELGSVQIGPAFRRSILEKDGREAVGGVVMMRYGENPLEITRRVKERITQISAGLPPGIRIVPFYDRTALIRASMSTLQHTLIEEMVIASIVVMLVLVHVRSAFVVCITLPLAVLFAFIFMYWLNVPSNIMSLSGIAIAIGVLVDAGIVMTENAYHTLQERFPGGRVTGDTRELITRACQLVGGPLFFSILIMLLSFAPVFLLGGMEGKMFNPLAYTKSFALVGVAILAITLVPALLPTFLRGRLRSQEEVWVVRSLAEIYRPMLNFFLDHPDAIVLVTGGVLLGGLPVFPHKVPWTIFTAGVPFLLAISVLMVARRKALCFAVLFLVALTAFRFIRPLGEEFMPPLDELSMMDMPVTTPNVNITQAGDSIRARDRLLRTVPEVHQVVGKIGRADTPTDPAPIDMVETTVTLHARELWPKRKLDYAHVLTEADAVLAALVARGLVREVPAAERRDFQNAFGMIAQASFDRAMRTLCRQRTVDAIPEAGRALWRSFRDELVEFLMAGGALQQDLTHEEWAALETRMIAKYATRWHEWILQEDVDAMVRETVTVLAERKVVVDSPTLLIDAASTWTELADTVRDGLGVPRPTLATRLRDHLEARLAAWRAVHARTLDAELVRQAPGTLSYCLAEEAIAGARARDWLLREPEPGEVHAVRAERERNAAPLVLHRKLKSDLVQEMDSELQFPGWGNIWTQPIINRVDMLATGVRTQIGVKVFGDSPEAIQQVSNEVAAVLRRVRGAVDVFPDQIVGENYLEITIDRERAARYGVRVEEIQDVIEVALGGKEITLTVEGRQRYPVRVRYPRDWREDEDALRNILVPTSSADGAAQGGMNGGSGKAGEKAGAAWEQVAGHDRLQQIPLSQLADIRVVPGPSMIKSEDGRLRAYVQCNVRDRDMVGFVDEAQQAVASQVSLPPGCSIAWSGQYEHQVTAQRTLKRVMPAVLLIIFVILYLTYRDLPDTLMMFLAVPGAIAGGAMFQALFGFNFSVAVWVGYIACFGLATETGIVMLVYLREALERHGGLSAMRSEADIRAAVMDGAVHRLRPKLLTEGTTILALIPMLWATGVGAEFMAPMAAPILGGILVADEVIDIFIPVLFFQERCRRWRRAQAGNDPVPAGPGDGGDPGTEGAR